MIYMLRNEQCPASAIRLSPPEICAVTLVLFTYPESVGPLIELHFTVKSEAFQTFKNTFKKKIILRVTF